MKGGKLMPLPLLPVILLAAAAGSAIEGVRRSIMATKNLKTAKRTNESANSILSSAKWKADSARKKAQKALECLGAEKVNILNTSIAHFISSFEKLKHVEIENSVGLDELKNFQVDIQTMKDLKEISNFATSLAKGLAGGAAGGALTAFGAWSAAGTLAAASTGTPIAALSGAAATNATLAFFGGGSLAVGGLGMAGGAVVLGGLVAGPALAILGLIVDAKAKIEKEKAYSNLAKAQKNAEELNSVSVLCIAIAKRCDMFTNVLKRLDARLQSLLIQMDKAIEEHNANFREFSLEQKQVVAKAVALVKAIKSIIDTPILTKDGNLTEESEDVINQFSE